MYLILDFIYGPCPFSIFRHRGGCSYAKLRRINKVHDHANENFLLILFFFQVYHSQGNSGGGGKTAPPFLAQGLGLPLSFHP